MSDSRDEKLRTTYDQLCYSYRAIDDFRAKLLGFLPLATGTGIFLLVPENKEGLLKEYLGPIGAFGFLITLGLFFYEIYGIKKCHGLILAGQQLEDQMDIRGQFRERPREVARFIKEPVAAGVNDPAELAAWTFLALLGQEWTFLALLGQEIFKWEAADWFFKWKAAPLFIAFCVFIVGFVCSGAYNLWLGTQKTYLAKLLDHKGKKLAESFFGSHRIAGARKSAKDWAKKYENIASIQLTDADDVSVTEKIPMEAPNGAASPSGTIHRSA
jgi:hypothetical protein